MTAGILELETDVAFVFSFFVIATGDRKYRQ